jgi:hypothetical protein
MKKIFIIFYFLCVLPCFSQTITGEIKKETKTNMNQVVDGSTNIPIEGVVIKIPSKHYITRTDKNGTFKLQTKIDSPTIMALEKSGYKPFSMTINSNNKTPLNISIEKTSINDIIVETKIIHIGDNSFSENSANANDFTLNANGAFYSKDFQIKPLKNNEELTLTIGSIIGIDTMEAQRIGQSHVLTAYSSPPELFFNGNKIAEIKINGDNQKIKIPRGIIKENQSNNVTIKTGRNLYKTSAIDYDDIEFTNLMFEIQ